MTVDLVVVGVSMGGLRALQAVLGGLPADFPIPIAVVQHRHRHSDDAFLAVLQPHTQLPLVEPDDKEPMRGKTVFIAPADYHLLAARGWFELCADEPVRFARPSVDVLFESAVDSYGAGVVAVVLTGANADGAAGARRIREAGGTVVAQDSSTAEAPQMPGAVIEAGLADHVVPIEEIAPLLLELCVAT